MDKYLIFATNGILSPLSVIDKCHNSKVIELSKEDAERLVKELNEKEGEESYYMRSLNDYYGQMRIFQPQIEKFNKSTLNLSEELRKDSQMKQAFDMIYKINNNNINGLDLPRTVESKEEYFNKAMEMLDDFASQIGEIAFDSQPNLKNEIEVICEKIKEALKHMVSGDIEQLDTTLRETIKDHFFDDFIVSELDKNYAFRGLAPFEELHSYGAEKKYAEMNDHDIEFFRARVSDKPIKNLGQMAHLPYDLRDLSSDMRFSAKGQVCLYLGTTTFDCAKECRWDEKQDLYVSCFKPNEKGKKMKILNLAISQYLINGLGKNRKLQNKMLKVFPLIIVTSFSIKNPNSNRPDYLISQRLIKILHDLGIDGVAYLSCQGESGLQYPHGVNLAIPVNDISEKKQYGEICEYFSMTDPLAVNKLNNNISVGSKLTFINEIYTEKYKSGNDNIISHVTYNGKDTFYGNTPFSTWDNCLVNQQFKDFKG